MMAPQQSQSPYGGGQQQNSMNSLTRGMNNMQFQQQPMQQQGFGGMQQPMRGGMAPMGGAGMNTMGGVGMNTMGGGNTMNRMNMQPQQQQQMGGGGMMMGGSGMMMGGGQMNNSNNFAQFKAS